jgi:outer membrane protein
MNRFTAIACLGLGIAVSPIVSSLVAVDAVEAGPPQTKVGVIDLERTLYETPAGKRASGAFEKTRKSKQGELDKKQKELQKAAEDLDKQIATGMLKEDVVKKKRAELSKQFEELQKTFLKLERDLNTERAKLIQDLLKKANPIVQEIAKAEGVHLIVDHSAVVFADPAIDLTEKLNAKMK